MNAFLRFAFILAMLSVSVQASAEIIEDWVAIYNNPNSYADEAKAIAVDDSGNILVTGRSSLISGSQYTDFLTIKYNPSGQLLWLARTDFGGVGGDCACAVGADSAGNVYVAGTLHDAFAGEDYLTIKYDTNGNEQWQARYDGIAGGSDQVIGLGLDAGGNVYVTGISQSILSDDIVTIKYNSLGEQLWLARWQGLEDAWLDLHVFAVDQNGNAYIAGTSDGNGTMIDYLTVKYDSEGHEQWTAWYDGAISECDEAQALAVDLYGNVYVSGRSDSRLGVLSNDNIVTIMYNSGGAMQWAMRYDGPLALDEEGRALVVDQEANVYVAGTGELEEVTGQWIIIKYDREGQEQWIQTYPGPGQGAISVRGMAIDENANIYVTGFIDMNPASGAIWMDYLTLKFDTYGNLIGEAIYDGPYVGNASDEAYAIALDEDGNAYVTGFCTGYTNSWDFCTVKYVEPSGIPQLPVGLPDDFAFYPPHPNPFNASTILSFDLPVASRVTLEVFDISGRMVTGLSGSGTTPTMYEAGMHQINFDGSDLPSGVYLYRIMAGLEATSGKLVLLK